MVRSGGWGGWVGGWVEWSGGGGGEEEKKSSVAQNGRHKFCKRRIFMEYDFYVAKAPLIANIVYGE